MAVSVCIGHAAKLEPAETIYFDYMENQDVLPGQIRRHQKINIDFKKIESGRSREGVASLFRNILKIGRDAIKNLYDDNTKNDIESFLVSINGVSRPRLILNDLTYRVDAMIPNTEGQYIAWRILERQDLKNILPRPPFDILDVMDDGYMISGGAPPDWPSDWGTSLFDTPLNLILRVEFKRGRAPHLLTIPENYTIWRRTPTGNNNIHI